ncbi:MAG: D-alanine--D-alanine ligase [Oscillospiraceae bacterium]|nr:D-alanine--D-alanine ligase [Oscillospiraceae bacterium]
MDIAVLCGGLGTERDVSLSSGTCVAKALRAKGHRATTVDLFFGYNGNFSDPKDVFKEPQSDIIFRVPEKEPDLNRVRSERKRDNGGLMADNVTQICAAADIVFLALHGDEGENGKIQAVFDVAGIKYTGSGYLGSALAMDKHLSKTLMENAGIKTPVGICLHKDDSPYTEPEFPCVVKPCSGGSSVGVSIVLTRAEYPEALELAFRFEKRVIAERFIKGRELTVGVLGKETMPVIEIVPKSGFYDYKNKYSEGLTEEICPASLDGETEKKLRESALIIHELLMIDVYSRMDFIMDETGEIFCIEANTLPGMTPTSLVPRMASEEGMDFGDLCERIIELSLEKYRQ